MTTKYIQDKYQSVSRRVATISCLLLATTSCQEFIDVGVPKTEITTATVFSSDASALATLSGVYSKMMASQSFTNGELERFTGIYADELINYSSNKERRQFATASLLNNNAIVLRYFWAEAYAYILNSNAILEGVRNSSLLSTAVKNQLEGEALFIRAFCHFYLVNLFGDVPYVTSIDYEINSRIARMTTTEVYLHIIDDLKHSKDLMQPEFSLTDPERIRPGKFAVAALLARVYLYTGNWPLAEQEASSVIDANTYSLTELENTFLATSPETIWQLRPVVPGTNTTQGILFIMSSSPASSLGAVSLTTNVMSTFEATDNRASNWIGTYQRSGVTYKFAYKYKVRYNDVVSEYSIVLRLAEQYLIRAEARAQQNKLVEAYADINTIRSRAGLIDAPVSGKNALLTAIEKERVCELFTENGHRWLDLKRTHRATEILTPIKAGWQDTDLLFPIPDAERVINTNLTQNPGY